MTSKEDEIKIGKKYKHQIEEKRIFELWQKEGLYRFKLDDDRPVFTIDTPPPYTNAPWHMGGAIHYSQIDMIARTMRMKNYRVLFPMGLDRNGLPIETQTEKENKISMHEVPREKFLEMCKALLDRYGSQILDLTFKLGLSCNSFEWDEVYKTDEEKYRALTQATFIELWKKNLIYEDDRPNIWDTKLQTTIADAEVTYKDAQHALYDIAFKVKETGEEFIISTTRPELIPSIGMVIYNPKDDRYRHLNLKTAIAPLFNIEVPIYEHPQADMNFGSGIMMICSFGDMADVRLFREYKIEPRYSIGPDGRMTENAGKYKGMTVKQARKAIVEDLKKGGFIRGEKMVNYRQPISERSKTEIEFIGMKEYYLKQVRFVKTLRKYADKMQFHPPHAKQIWLDWLDSISMDWPISRRRYYGTEVPVWYCKSCGEPHLPEPGKYYQPWKDKAPFEKCKKCGATEFRGDERTFDTWMDSSISAIYTLLHPHNQRNDEFFNEMLEKRDYISDLRPQGKDIVRTWLHYSMLRAEQLYKRPAFKHAWISGHVVTETGEKMSKSKGNIVKPEPVIEQFGGDALRLFGALEASHGSDVRFSIERLRGTAKFLNKLFNIAKFVSGFPMVQEGDEYELLAADKWIMNELNAALQKAMKGYEVFDFHIPARELKGFIKDLFASQYIELVKSRAYNRENKFTTAQANGARKTLYDVLNKVLRAYAPIIPFLTDYLYRAIWKKSVHTELFPEYQEPDKEMHILTQYLLEYNSLIWSLKKQAGKSLKDKIKEVHIPVALRDFKDDLVAMHNIEKPIITIDGKLEFSRPMEDLILYTAKIDDNTDAKS